MKPKAILLIGKARSGKDTFAEIAKKNYDVTRYAYADNLKKVCATIMGVPVSRFYENKFEMNDDWGMTYREVLQLLGTDALRNHFREDIWVKSLYSTVQSETNFEKDIIITDCRFENEIDIMREKFDVVTVQIFRPDTDAGDVKGGVTGHVSENMEVDTEYICGNIGTLEDFEVEVNGVLEDIYTRRGVE